MKLEDHGLPLKHIVIELSDLYELDEGMIHQLADINLELRKVRQLQGKPLDPEYIVVDCSEPWAYKVSDVIHKETTRQPTAGVRV